MIERLIEFVARDSGATPYPLTLQDIALCRLWCATQTKAGRESASVPAVEQRVARWITDGDTPDLNTAGRRHQRLIRFLFDKLEQEGVASLQADEAAFLATASAVAEESGGEAVHGRFCALVARFREGIQASAEAQAPSVDLHQLAMHVQYASEADVRAAAVTSIRLFAGIELPCRGPVFKSRTHLRLLGDVPENCTVVVENEGACSVDGYVLGRILAKNYCEIRHNIAGVAIVLGGSIRARSIINNAFVVAKMGDVHCHNAQGPKLVFAGSSIHIRECAMLGKFITRRMAVGDEVRGSHVEVAGDCRAQAYKNLGMSNVTIVLRRDLSCEDFGEVTGDELKRLLSRAYSLRRSAHNFSNMAAAARLEGEHTAQSALMYIFGGGEVQKRLQGFLHAQRRHTLVTNVVDNLERILEQAQDGMVSELEPAEAEVSAPLESDDDAPVDEEIAGVRVETEALEKSLRAKNLNRVQRSLLLDEVRSKLSAMRELQQEAFTRMKEEEQSIQHLEKYEQVLAGSGDSATKVEVLQKILPAMQRQPAESTMGKRLRSSFIVRALRSVERSVRHEREFSTRAADSLQDFRSVTERLGREYQVRVLEDPEGEDEAARVTGVFEAGIRVFMDCYFENIAEAPQDSYFVTADDSGMRTFIRTGAGSRFFCAKETR